jgi:hypothetical protein
VVVARAPIVLFATRRGSARLDVQPWLLSDTAKLHVAIMGGLAGFAVTGLVLLVGLARNQPGIPEAPFDTVVTMFVVAYFYYVGNAFLISATGQRRLAPRVHFSLASTIEYRTLFVSWFALRPLLEVYGLDRPVQVLVVLLPASLVLGSVIIAMAADGLGLLRVKETYLAAVVGTVFALGSAAVARWWAPDIRTADSALFLTLVIFFVNGLGSAWRSRPFTGPRASGLLSATVAGSSWSTRPCQHAGVPLACGGGGDWEGLRPSDPAPRGRSHRIHGEADVGSDYFAASNGDGHDGRRHGRRPDGQPPSS